jgi:hypothetical protein
VAAAGQALNETGQLECLLWTLLQPVTLLQRLARLSRQPSVMALIQLRMEQCHLPRSQ